MDDPAGAEDPTTVDPTDRERVRTHLERFAGPDAVTEADGGTLTAEFSASTFVAVGPDGHVNTGMPLHGFEGVADSMEFDHETGELRVSAGDDEIAYVFRRP